MGILPLYGLQQSAFLHNEVPGMEIPEPKQPRMRQAREKPPEEGVLIALELKGQMRSWAGGVCLCLL